MDRLSGPKLGLIGTGTARESASKLAFETGRQVARSKAVLICGGRGGVMEAGCSGAKSAGGLTIGVLPGTDADDTPPNPHVDLALYTGLGQARNLIIVLSSDALIAIGGGWGTLSEISLAKKHGVPVVLLESWTLEGPDGQGLDDMPRAASAKEAVAKALMLVRDSALPPDE